MGEQLPRTGSEQRDARLANSIQGVIPDGILVRCSVVGDSQASFGVLASFVPDMLKAVRPGFRPALIGTQLSRQFA
jgi:hypothetical protein